MKGVKKGGDCMGMKVFTDTDSQFFSRVFQPTASSLKMEPRQTVAANLQTTANQTSASLLNAMVKQTVAANMQTTANQTSASLLNAMVKQTVAANMQTTANQTSASLLNAMVKQTVAANLQTTANQTSASLLNATVRQTVASNLQTTATVRQTVASNLQTTLGNRFTLDVTSSIGVTSSITYSTAPEHNIMNLSKFSFLIKGGTAVANFKIQLSPVGGTVASNWIDDDTVVRTIAANTLTILEPIHFAKYIRLAAKQSAAASSTVSIYYQGHV